MLDVWKRGRRTEVIFLNCMFDMNCNYLHKDKIHFTQSQQLQQTGEQWGGKGARTHSIIISEPQHNNQ